MKLVTARTGFHHDFAYGEREKEGREVECGNKKGASELVPM